jgi:uncharacterized membrane protein
MLNSNRLYDLNHSFTNVTIFATKATTTKDVVRSARHQTDHVYDDVAFPAVIRNILTYQLMVFGNVLGHCTCMLSICASGMSKSGTVTNSLKILECTWEVKLQAYFMQKHNKNKVAAALEFLTVMKITTLKPPINPTPRSYLRVMWIRTLLYPGSCGRR